MGGWVDFDMYRYSPLLLFIGLAFWSCEEEVEEDTTPPTVSISSHSSGQTVNEIVTIIVTTQDNEGISEVEFFIDDSLVFTDNVSPYEYDWNTTQYGNGEHIVKVISYDNSYNLTESQPILLIVGNIVYLWGEYYPWETTTYLYLFSNQLTGEIPSEIGNLTNLGQLFLNNNGLTGEISESICDIYPNLSSFNISNNQLCPPYPSCIEDYMGTQDTSDCP